MKNDFFSKIKNGIKSAVNFPDDEGEEYYDDEDYYDEEDEEGYYDEDDSASSNDNSGYYSSSSQKKNSRFNEYDFAPSYTPSPDFDSPKKSAHTSSGAKIYDMNSAKPQKDLNINLFVLEDLDDARNVADCMKKRNMVCIVDFSRVSFKEERRVLDFLDGVKYILQSKVTKIADRMYLIVPGSTVLTGPFEDNFDIDYD